MKLVHQDFSRPIFEEKDNFVELIKKEYPSLKNKNEETILKSLLYYIANEPIINIIKTTKK